MIDHQRIYQSLMTDTWPSQLHLNDWSSPTLDAVFCMRVTITMQHEQKKWGHGIFFYIIICSIHIYFLNTYIFFQFCWNKFEFTIVSLHSIPLFFVQVQVPCTYCTLFFVLLWTKRNNHVTISVYFSLFALLCLAPTYANHLYSAHTPLLLFNLFMFHVAQTPGVE